MPKAHHYGQRVIDQEYLPSYDPQEYSQGEESSSETLHDAELVRAAGSFVVVVSLNAEVVSGLLFQNAAGNIPTQIAGVALALGSVN